MCGALVQVSMGKSQVYGQQTSNVSTQVDAQDKGDTYTSRNGHQ